MLVMKAVDCAAQLARDGKAHLDPEADTILQRLRVDAPAWRETVSRLFQAKQSTGSHLGSSARLSETARQHGRRWHRNLFRRIASPADPAALTLTVRPHPRSRPL